MVRIATASTMDKVAPRLMADRCVMLASSLATNVTSRSLIDIFSSFWWKDLVEGFGGRIVGQGPR